MSYNDTLFKTEIDEIDTPFKTKHPENHTLSGRTSPLRFHGGVTPPGSNQGSTNQVYTRRALLLRLALRASAEAVHLIA